MNASKYVLKFLEDNHMRDFTLQAYTTYLDQIKRSYKNILTVADYFKLDAPLEPYIIMRHDVDRKPNNALFMAELEKTFGIVSTYYFRDKSESFNPEIIRKISGLGHEIGYHYECLSDTNGDIVKAIELFKVTLFKFRRIVDVTTVSMHGRPFSIYDSRDMFRDPIKRKDLFNSLGVLGDTYLDISYKDIAYISDTGRCWSGTKYNIRDHVESSIVVGIETGMQLYEALRTIRFEKVCLSVHPERWTDSPIEYITQFAKDILINLLKDAKSSYAYFNK